MRLDTKPDVRTIVVLEHETIAVYSGDASRRSHSDPATNEARFSEAEAHALLLLNHVRPGFCQRVAGGIKISQYCGIVRLPTCVIEILPKLGWSSERIEGEPDSARAALLKMLAGARHLKILNAGLVQQKSVQSPLLDIFIEAFLEAAAEQSRRGLLSRYVPQAEDLQVIKGRFHVYEHLRRNAARPHLLHCEYDEFTYDNAYNRAIRTALDVCRTWPVQGSTQRLWFETHARFASITPARMTAKEVARLHLDRTTERYRPVLDWCGLILSLSAPSISAGLSRAPGLLFDMNKLFEDYVSGLEESAAGDSFVVRRHDAKPLAKHGTEEAFTLKPDITVWHRNPDGNVGGIARIVDAKWKRLDHRAANWGVDKADIYQLLAYSVGYKCQKMELVYPLPDHQARAAKHPVFRIDSEKQYPVEIHIKTVPMWGT